MKIINWNEVTSKATMIQEFEIVMQKIVKMLCLEVMILGQIDCIRCHKIMEFVRDNGNIYVL